MQKKAFLGAGYGIIAAFVILFLSVFIIVQVIQHTSKKVDQKLQVDLCRVSNEVHFGMRDKTSNWVGGPQICRTIDKSATNMQVPTNRYQQNADGSSTEIRDMIKDCWYMWLEGSRANMFDGWYPGAACHTCFTFKIKEGKDGGVSFTSVSSKLEEPFIARDTSDQCSAGGGFWRTECDRNRGEKAFGSRQAPDNPSAQQKCCLKGAEYECENRGGRCSASSASGTIYNQWSCPNRDQSCYVNASNVFAYTKYVREYGTRSGDIQFVGPQGSTTVDFSSGKIYAISFLSPNGVLCWSEDASKCFASLGNNWYVPVILAVGTGVAVGVAVYTFPIWGTVAAVVGPIVSFIGAPLIALVGGTALYRYSGDAVRWVTSPITTEVPNFILVSEVQHAQQLGCTINYATNNR